MKFVILGDTHLGMRNGSSHFARHANRFFSEVLYPYMRENKINRIIQLGDLFDNRTNLSLKAFHLCKPEWFDPLVENDFEMIALLGNHDITLRESLSINSPESLLGEYIESGHLQVIKEPTPLRFEGVSIDVIPWICRENQEEVVKFMNRKKVSELCVGHFEINGFQMYRGIPGHGGMEPKIFDRYEAVFSGHYHTRSKGTDNQIQYVGTPYEITWMDAHDPRGFTVFDTDTRKAEFIPNPHTMFHKVFYKNGCEIDTSTLQGKLVKLIVERKDDLFAFDKFLNQLKLADPYDLAILENMEDLKGGTIDDETIEVENTIQIIGNYIDGLTTHVDKSKVKGYINSLYVEALNS